MSEAEPKFLERLQQTFIENMHIGASEQDYTDTLAYAHQFIGQVARLKENPPKE
jgi:hypothetical protein